MIHLHAVLSQHYTPATLPAAVRATLGKPLRRAAGLTQLALTGALACLPADRRHSPTALLWQSTSGPRQETLTLLKETCSGAGEPMPYDFLATQPAIAAAQIQPFLPGLLSATHIPLDTFGAANWSLLLTLAANWLAEGRYAQVLCAHLDHGSELADGHWLVVGNEALENTLAGLHVAKSASAEALADTPEFPAQLARWLEQPDGRTLNLMSPAHSRLAVEFIRL
jgi:hypothetical protein